MARRRKSKARQTQELIQGAITFVLLGTFYLSYQTTHSLNAAVVMTGVVLGLGISAMIYMALARKERLKRSGIAEIDTMDGFLFEKYLGHLFRSQGYDVIVTKPSGDFGADLVIKKNGQKIVVQAKRYSSNVGIKAVRRRRLLSHITELQPLG